MRITHGIACALTAAFATAGAQATFIHFDLNAITVDAGENFDGATHTGTLVLGVGDDSVLSAIEVDSVSQPLSGDMATLVGEIVLVNGQVAGGFISFTADDGAEYIASINGGAGQVNTQAGLGFRIDGLTNSGLLDNLVGGTDFAGANLTSNNKPFDPTNLAGSFLLHGFGPDANGFDGLVDLDLFIQIPVPAPGSAALAFTAAGIAGVRRRR